jgi:DNA-directed RNA polymerase subunit RPC12/RpoP
MGKCVDCGKEMNLVEVMLGPVCGDCTDKKVEAITGIKRQRRKIKAKKKKGGIKN